MAKKLSDRAAKAQARNLALDAADVIEGAYKPYKKKLQDEVLARLLDAARLVNETKGRNKVALRWLISAMMMVIAGEEELASDDIASATTAL